MHKSSRYDNSSHPDLLDHITSVRHAKDVTHIVIEQHA